MSKIKVLVGVMEILERRITEMQALTKNEHLEEHSDIKILIGGHTYNFPINSKEFIRCMENLAQDEIRRVKNQIKQEL